MVAECRAIRQHDLPVALPRNTVHSCADRGRFPEERHDAAPASGGLAKYRRPRVASKRTTRGEPGFGATTR